MLKIKFDNNKAQFFAALRQRTDLYFQENNIKMSGNYKLYTKTVVLMATLVAIYYVLIFMQPLPVWLSLVLSALMGINFAVIGFNIMHDGAHGSYSTKSWVNKTMAHVLNLMGGNVYLWNLKHNVNHHTFTNIEGVDDDIDLKPFIRIHADQERKAIHRFQHFYVFILYGLTLLFWVFYRDFKKYFTGQIAEFTPMKKMQLSDHFIFWISKIVHFAIFLFIPAWFVGFGPMVLGYIVMAYASGLVLAIVFQLAHVVEDSGFVAGENNVAHIKEEWAIHQVKTTANFATNNRFLCWMLGGLNFQVEHHLFPKISHIHYPSINHIVKETCREFNIPYREFPTMTSAIRSHLVHIKRTGRE